jgi:DNA-binding transcriptional regulator GbsR (MarR family)
MAQLELSVPQEAKKDEVEPLTQSFAELFNEYPETADMKELSDFPDEVQKAIKEGKSPVVAYSKYLAKKAEQEKAIAVQNESARLRDTGSLQTAEPEGKGDKFLEGLFG